MQEEHRIRITAEGEELFVEDGSSLHHLAEQFEDPSKPPIALAMVNGKLTELRKKVKENSEISFLRLNHPIGMETYRRSLVFLMLTAVSKVPYTDGSMREIRVDFSIDRGLFCRFREDTDWSMEVDEEWLKLLEEKMQEMVLRKLPIKKHTMSTDHAIERFREAGMQDKVELFGYRRASSINLYRLDDYEDYFYGYMMPDTSELKVFKLYPYKCGFVLQMPHRKLFPELHHFVPQDKLFRVMRASSRWHETMGISTVGELNDRIASGGQNDLILMQEAIMEKRIGDIAAEIHSDAERRIVMIAGPSSSGKTTFANRLSIQLQALGYEPRVISVDNYFVNREDSPRDENGDYNFEDLEALDIEAFNDDMLKLLGGEKVTLPTYNFISGKREYKTPPIELTKRGILVIEGIHCLNQKLSYRIPKHNTYKIYISALTQLNIDQHNRISTTDGRLLRRLVRDARTRGASAVRTIQMWKSVRRGEEKNIFPYQEEADYMINSALIYELAVLKPYAEAELFGVPKDVPEYMEAKRLLKFLDYFLTIPSESIPSTSLLREFIGGGCFDI